MTRQLARLLFAVVALGGLSACSTSDSEESTVLFRESGERVAGAMVTPLAGSLGPDGNVAVFAIDPNASSTITDDDGRFQLDYSVVPETAGVQVTIDVDSAVGPAVGQLDWRATFDPEVLNQELAIPEPQPCTADVVCGELLLPDLTPVIGWSELSPETVERLTPLAEGPPTAGLFPSETWFVEDGDDRRLLRFATVAANIGEGPLDIIAEPGDGDGARTWQRMWTDSWHFEDRLSGEFLSHPTHDHIHFDAFERYRLLDDEGAVVASSEKVSFCLRDSVRVVDELPSPIGPMLVDAGDCAGQQQVINPGFGDHYHALLDDQWIDISGVPAGTYTVEIAVDPLDLIDESDESNNIGTFEVEID